ncbi:MAG TPA: hypothetical protein VGI39_19065 [Polyangiaceae bacterium]|jgi:hypothetical protein
MTLISFARLGLLAVPFLGASLAAKTAAADTPQQFHIDYPATACFGATASFNPWNSSLTNSSSSAQNLFCPILSDDQVGNYQYAAAFITTATGGIPNGGSCWLGVSNKNGNGHSIGATSLSYESGYIALNFSSPAIGAQTFVDLECSLPPQVKLAGYTVGQTWYDWY